MILMSDGTLNKALHIMGYKDRMTVHGFRGVASTELHEMGYPHEHIELQLAHMERNKVSAAYNHAKYVPQRKKMMQDWADFLHISGKTLSRYQKEDKSFDVLQSEKILQIEMLYKRGEDVFGSSENFLIWLQSENIALGKTKPQDLLGSVFGISLLMDELTRIEHGVLA